jgi:hypothetical protein
MPANFIIPSIKYKKDAASEYWLELAPGPEQTAAQWRDQSLMVEVAGKRFSDDDMIKKQAANGGMPHLFGTGVAESLRDMNELLAPPKPPRGTPAPPKPTASEQTAKHLAYVERQLMWCASPVARSTTAWLEPARERSEARGARPTRRRRERRRGVMRSETPLGSSREVSKERSCSR